MQSHVLYCIRDGSHYLNVRRSADSTFSVSRSTVRGHDIVHTKEEFLAICNNGRSIPLAAKQALEDFLENEEGGIKRTTELESDHYLNGYMESADTLEELTEMLAEDDEEIKTNGQEDRRKYLKNVAQARSVLRQQQGRARKA